MPDELEPSVASGESKSKYDADAQVGASIRPLVTPFFATLFAAALLNFVVNPFGLYPARFFERSQDNFRIKKFELASNFNPPPDTLVIGSSRVMTMRPSDVERHLGGRAFNWGVPSATAEDYYAATRLFTENLGINLSTIIVAVDLEAFNPAEPLMPEARYFQDYADFLLLSPEADASSFEKFSLILSMQQTKESIAVIRRKLEKTKGSPKTIIENDGYVFQSQREKTISEGTFDLGKILALRVRKYPVRSLKLEGFTHADERRLEYLRLFLNFCRDRNIKVYAYITPYHPELWKVIGAIPESSRLREIENAIGNVFENYGVTLHNFSRVENFSGDSRRFYDEIHGMPDLESAILDELFLRESAREASDELAKADSEGRS